MIVLINEYLSFSLAGLTGAGESAVSLALSDSIILGSWRIAVGNLRTLDLDSIDDVPHLPVSVAGPFAIRAGYLLAFHATAGAVMTAVSRTYRAAHRRSQSICATRAAKHVMIALKMSFSIIEVMRAHIAIIANMPENNVIIRLPKNCTILLMILSVLVVVSIFYVF